MGCQWGCNQLSRFKNVERFIPIYVGMYGGRQKHIRDQRVRAARPNVAMPAKAFTPTMEPAELEEEAAGAEELVDEPAVEAEAEWLEAGVVVASG